MLLKSTSLGDPVGAPTTARLVLPFIRTTDKRYASLSTKSVTNLLAQEGINASITCTCINYQSIKCGKHIPHTIRSGQQCFDDHMRYSSMRMCPVLAINSRMPAGIARECFHKPVYVDRRGGEPSRRFCDTDLKVATCLRTELEESLERK